MREEVRGAVAVVVARLDPYGDLIARLAADRPQVCLAGGDVLFHLARDAEPREQAVQADRGGRVGSPGIEQRARLLGQGALQRTADAVHQSLEAAGVVRIERQAAGVQGREVEAVIVRATELFVRERAAGVRDLRLLLRLVEGDLGVLLVALGIGVGHAVAEGLVGRRIIRVAAGWGARVARWSEDPRVALDLALDHRVGALERPDHLQRTSRPRSRTVSGSPRRSECPEWSTLPQAPRRRAGSREPGTPLRSTCWAPLPRM